MNNCDCNQGRLPCTCKVSILKDASVTCAASSGAAPVPPAGDVDRFCIYNEDGKLSLRVAANGYWCRHDDFTRLTAERDGLLAQLTESRRQVQLLSEAGEFLDDVSQGVEDKLHAENAALQSELTKARELLGPLAEYATDSRNAVMRARAVEARKLIAHQSAPAACWTPANHECPGDGVGACKKCPNAPAAKGGSDE